MHIVTLGIRTVIHVQSVKSEEDVYITGIYKCEGHTQNDIQQTNRLAVLFHAAAACARGLR